MPKHKAIDGICERVQKALNDDLLPERLHEPLLGYLIHGHHPGSFVEALLTGDMANAVNRCDHSDLVMLGFYFRFLVQHFPVQAWGDESRFRAWVEEGGLAGKMAKERADV